MYKRQFETVTYIIDGTFEHADSHGGGGTISNGDTQWMTAGGGVLHIERPPEHLVVSGGLFHGIQLWVNLPAKDKMAAPRYQSLEGDQVTLLSSIDGGALVRLIAGDLAGHRGPGSTHTPISVAHVTIAPGARLVLPWRSDFNDRGRFTHSWKPWNRPPEMTRCSGGTSMCKIPAPAVIHCVSPLVIRPPPPFESECWNSPSMM